MGRKSKLGTSCFSKAFPFEETRKVWNFPATWRNSFRYNWAKLIVPRKGGNEGGWRRNVVKIRWWWGDDEMTKKRARSNKYLGTGEGGIVRGKDGAWRRQEKKAKSKNGTGTAYRQGGSNFKKKISPNNGRIDDGKEFMRALGKVEEAALGQVRQDELALDEKNIQQRDERHGNKQETTTGSIKSILNWSVQMLQNACIFASSPHGRKDCHMTAFVENLLLLPIPLIFVSFHAFRTLKFKVQKVKFKWLIDIVLSPFRL